LGVVHSRPHFFRLSHFLGVHLFETGVGRVVLGRGNHIRFGLGRQHGSCFVIAHHHVGVLNVFVHGHEERVRGYQCFELGVGRRAVTGLSELLGGLDAPHQGEETREVNADFLLGVAQVKGLLEVEHPFLLVDGEQLGGAHVFVHSSHLKY